MKPPRSRRGLERALAAEARAQLEARPRANKQTALLGPPLGTATSRPDETRGARSQSSDD